MAMDGQVSLCAPMGEVPRLRSGLQACGGALRETCLLGILLAA